MKRIQEILEYKLVDLDNFSLTAYHIILIVALVFMVRTALWAIKKFFYQERLKQRVGEGRLHGFFQIVKYIIIVIAVVIGLESIGVKVTFLLAGSAALLVGLGFGLQQIFNDFISGIILLFDGTIKVGEVIEIEGIVGRVESIGLRTSEIETRDNIIMIIPNSFFTSQKVINWSHNRQFTRFRISIGVAYGSDTALVKKVLLECADEHKYVAKKPDASVRFIDFGDSALMFELLFYSENMFRIERVKSDVRFLVDMKFKENGIHIPFPQRDLHIKAEQLPQSFSPDSKA
ncbi:MAG: mechanosensitive ion channel protein MscS [Bacteroidetes bacterium]|nr:MAG: mechanosensitive ion channel protein MscS [Bacteroidota bacterium]